MENTRTLFFALLVTLLVTFPAVGQDEGGRGRGDSGAPSVAAPSIASRGVSAGAAPSSNVGASSSRDTGGTSSSIGNTSFPSASSGYASQVPDLRGTSFNSMNCYYEWQDFFWRLRTRYMLDSFYFSRFYRNSEPLVTPELMRLTLREPLSLSKRMVTAVNDLEVMLADLQAGRAVNKQAIAAKSQEIRDLAKKIRTDQSLAFVDRRLDKDLAKGNRFDNLGLEAIRELREMATDLHTQLNGMYTQTATSSVSVHNLTQPSLESLSKGIEKLSKVIENSARRL